MKKVTIKEITLTNWKAHTGTFNFSAENNNHISGRNGSGKTLIFKAWCWLLTGKSDPFSVANHELYDNREPVTKDTPKASVCAVIDIDGTEMKIERTAESKWIRKRGTDIYEKAASDEYHFILDDIEVNVARFKELIESNIAKFDLLPYCIGGEFFTVLIENDRDKAQKTLAEIIGDVSEDEFDCRFAGLIEELKQYSIEELKSQNTTRRNKLKTAIQSIPFVIESKQEELATLEAQDWEDMEAGLEEAKKQYADADAAILSDAERDRELLRKRNEALAKVEEIRGQMRIAEAKYNADIEASLASLYAEKDRVTAENQAIIKRNAQKRMKSEEAAAEARKLSARLTAKMTQREALLEKRNAVKMRQFDESSLHCPTCGAEYDVLKQEEIRAAFNAKKQADLDEVIARGRELRMDIDDLKARIEGWQEAANNPEPMEQEISIEEIEAKIKAQRESYSPFNSTAAYEVLKASMEEAEAAVPEISLSSENEVHRIKKAAALTAIGNLNRRLGMKARIPQLQEEIKECQSRLRAQSDELAAVEGKQALIDAYENTKADIISCHANECLVNSQVITRKQLKSGDWISFCEITDKSGVKYSTLNGAARVLSQVDMQRMFCNRLGVSMPIFVDECNIFDSEHLPGFADTQMFYIFASDQPLTVHC